MDFIVVLRWTKKKYDSIWETLDRMNNSAHFIPVKSTYLVEDYTRIYIIVVLIYVYILEIISMRFGYSSEVKQRFLSSNE